MTAPQPINNPRIPREPGYNRRRYYEQMGRGNIQRALAALRGRAAGPEERIVKIYQASLAGAIVGAEQASAARDAASPT